MTKSKTTKPSKTVLEWTERYASYIAAVHRRFDFLSERHGFTSKRVTVIPPECAVSYERPDGISVTISSEYCGPAWVSVRGGTQLRSFGLHELVAQLDPGFAQREPAVAAIPSAAEQDARLAYAAAFLDAHAAAIFDGNDDLFARLRAARGSGLD